MTRIALIVSVVAFLLYALSGGVYYTSRMSVRFDAYAYTNHLRHKEFNLWWDAAETRSLGWYWFLDWTVEEEGPGELQLGFIKEKGAADEVVIRSAVLTDAAGNAQAPIGVLPVSVAFRDKTFPLFDEEAVNGRDVERSYAEVVMSPRLVRAGSPYTLVVSGQYASKNGGETPFRMEETIRVVRVRKLEHISASYAGKR